MPLVHLITPARAIDNNGNWQTARRWQSFLASQHEVNVTNALEPAGATAAARNQDVMIALHARRSADSINAFALAGGRVAVVMTGTDLYRDIHSDTSAQRSLEQASLLVVLHEAGIKDLPPAVHHKARVIFQSAPSLKAMDLRRPRRHFDIVLVGHLRAEKDPLTALRAMSRLGLDARDAASKQQGTRTTPARLIQIGADKDEALGRDFARGAAALDNVLRLGALHHAETRQHIRKAQALVLPSLMEGGANVLIEAVCAGVPVLASRISGSVGMLGSDYDGFFDVGDDAALAALIRRCQSDAAFHCHLQQQCQARAPLFAVAREREAVRALARDLGAG